MNTLVSFAHLAAYAGTYDKKIHKQEQTFLDNRFVYS